MKSFWHLIDIYIVNAWNLYHHHYVQYGKTKLQSLSLSAISVDMGNALIYANKPVVKKLGQPTK